MFGVIGVIAFLTALGLSLVITRVATVALTMTGLSQQAARFQARSAFTGTGFTTSEAEQVVNHPVRRQIIMLLMVVRSAGFVTIIISLILSFSGPEAEGRRLLLLFWILGGVAVLWLLAVSKLMDKYLEIAIQKLLTKWTDLDTRDYASLLRLSGDYSVNELKMKSDDWLVGKQLKDCRLRNEGVTILGILRADGTYVGVPYPDTEIYEGDTLILYGRSDNLRELDTRPSSPSGDAAHEEAVNTQNRKKQEQDQQEAKSKKAVQAQKELDEQKDDQSANMQ
ncbi:potassium/proton antiporter [Anaerohalosphaera lusitana]|uniref:Potassium/proton antiporter n=1 Tax=Anaerohalosphaera lusitana TaxID=1936003 RepID=A0A1U9NR78_9BACT|nr:TrkA C-terminal domain-containing protein [Anaerohalosphaera lusitana]AQT70130.1 potassium/proton antiporter [Anaerohalosphaera lusitana]